jgi:protein tyrosine phosphatase (PTP) superfamily phosphohydrolase (DUF442 family)
MDLVSLPQPFMVGGIRNFGWVEPGVVARGEQPALTESTFRVLRDHGIRSVVSLRPDREPPPEGARRVWPEYRVAEEQALAERVGLRFAHAPLEDFAAPSPEEIARALAALEDEVRAAPAVYVHCRAGAGRTALVTGAWMIANGRSGDEAAALYQHFMEHTARSAGLATDELPAMLRRVGAARVWWALQQIARALGSPVVRPFGLPTPERPPTADDWEAGYRRTLRPWRQQRAYPAQ